MTFYVANHMIIRTPKNGPLTKVHGYDDDGNPIIRVCSEEILPGQIFDEDNPEEEAFLLAGDAVRLPSDLELAAYEQLGANR